METRYVYTLCSSSHILDLHVHMHTAVGEFTSGKAQQNAHILQAKE